MYREYEKEQGPAPQYQITKELSDLTLMFIVSAIIFFLIAGAHGIAMRIIQSDIMLMGPNDETLTFGLFYSALTIHGQMMFFGFASMLTIGISYYLISKFAKKPLHSMNLAIWSFATLNAGVILVLVSGVMFFGAGWYNLMPLTFMPGGVGWSLLSAVIFLMADLLIVIGLTLFSLNIIATVLSGKIAAGMQKIELEYDEGHRSRSDGEDDKGRADMLTMQDIPPATRWISILGISSWLPKKHRRAVPAVSIVVVAVFVNALVQLIGNAGAFTQLALGLSFLTNPNFEANWLFAKDAWWFFGHPIVYFTLFSFLGAAYYYIPRYTKKTVPYDKWAYRPWPFYFVFTMMVFSHHTFMDMPNPAWLEMVAQAASFGIVFPSGLTIMTIMMYILRSRIKWNISSIFIVAGIAGWAFGGFAGVQTAWWGTNIYLHNTLHIVGHIHLIILMGSALLGLGLIYSIVPAITKKNLNRTLGFSHIILTLIGGFGLAFMFTYLGFAGVIRREAEIPEQFMWAMPWLLFFALTVGIAQIIFSYNMFRTLYRKYIAGEELFILHHHHHSQQSSSQQHERTQNEQKINQGNATTSAAVSHDTETDTSTQV
jgi:heme/copper-type cytochrome/quinol oxidase subunit 1